MITSNPAIALLICGGTFDKDYNPQTGELEFPQSQVATCLLEANAQLNLRPEIVLQKDSLEMDDADRNKLLKACLKAEENLIVITHGTDTMTTSAKFLKENSSLKDKTIILTGAMRPFALGKSDASFNLGAALMASQLAPAGIYIAMNGQLFAAAKVQKNLELGIFEATQ